MCQGVMIYVPGGYDICARGFGNRRRDAYFNVRAYHPNSPSYCSMGIHHRDGCKDIVNE